MKRELSPSQMLDMRKFGFSPAYVAREAGISEGYVSRLAPLHRRKKQLPDGHTMSKTFSDQEISAMAFPPVRRGWWAEVKRIMNWN